MHAGDPMGSPMVHQLMGHARPVMPPPPAPLLSQADQRAIQDWIRQGCSEDGFARVALPVFRRACAGCHAPGVAAGGISFATYQLVRPHIRFRTGR